MAEKTKTNMTEIRFDDYSTLIHNLRSGDEKTVILFSNKFYYRLGYFGFSLINDTHEASGIAADVIMKCVELIKAGRPFETMQNLKAFLYVSVRNRCFTYLRQQQAGRQRVISLEELSETTEPVPEMGIDKSEIIAEIFKELENLSKNEREVFTLSYVEGCSNSEISEKLNLSDKTVRNLKSSALNKLRTSVGKKLMLYLVLIGLCPN